MKLTKLLHEDDEFSFNIEPNSIAPQVGPGSTNITPAAAPQNPTDTVTLDVPLLIRLLEWAKEDAKDDMQLHKMSEKLISMSKNDQTLTMQNYDAIVSVEDTGAPNIKNA